MIRALLLGAFATTSMAAVCEKDLGQNVCRSFTGNNDFHIDNSGATDVIMTYKTLLNRAFSYVGQAPWDKDADWGVPAALVADAVPALGNQGPGWAFREAHDDDTNAAVTATSVDTYDLDAGTAGSNMWTSLTADGVKCGDKTITFTGTLQALVSNLDTDGAYTLYFQRVLPNPVQGNSLTLKWIAENACKVKVSVEFECTGTDCVEITTIVCASFAGITANTFGSVSTECKVPQGFALSTTAVTGGVAQTDDATITHSLAGTWTDSANYCNTATANQGGRCVFQHDTQSAISGVVAGTITYSAFVKAVSDWTNSPQELHKAKYNLTVESGLVKTFDMDVNVRFFSNTDTGAVRTTHDTQSNNDIPDLRTECLAGLEINDLTNCPVAFPTSLANGPFLARSRVEMGALVQHKHAYLQVVAQVDAPNSRFKDLRVSKIVHTKVDATGAVTTPTVTESTVAGALMGGAPICSVATGGLPAGQDTATSATGHWTSSHYPQAYMHCENLMSNGVGGGAVVAGDTLVISLKWKLSKGPWTSGKAQLLQQEDAAGQSVEVSLTIQLGGGETTITTAGAGGEGSADNTVTYIIIAVCVIAAALILAVVVVAFMCLRNRSQEQLVAMSPQKATVAAVYDISQPKAKADAMDV